LFSIGLFLDLSYVLGANYKTFKILHRGFEGLPKFPALAYVHVKIKLISIWVVVDGGVT
jgi:hypothetical protein